MNLVPQDRPFGQDPRVRQNEAYRVINCYKLRSVPDLEDFHLGSRNETRPTPHSSDPPSGPRQKKLVNTRSIVNRPGRSRNREDNERGSNTLDLDVSLFHRRTIADKVGATEPP